MRIWPTLWTLHIRVYVRTGWNEELELTILWNIFDAIKWPLVFLKRCKYRSEHYKESQGGHECNLLLYSYLFFWPVHITTIHWLMMASLHSTAPFPEGLSIDDVTPFFQFFWIIFLPWSPQLSFENYPKSPFLVPPSLPNLWKAPLLTHLSGRTLCRTTG